MSASYLSIAWAEHNLGDGESDNRERKYRAHKNTEPRHEPASIPWRASFVPSPSNPGELSPSDHHSRQHEKKTYGADEVQQIEVAGRTGMLIDGVADALIERPGGRSNQNSPPQGRDADRLLRVVSL